MVNSCNNDSTVRRLDSLTDLKAIRESLPVEFGPCNTAIPCMIIFPSVIGKQGKLITDFLPSLCHRHRLEIVTKLLFKAYYWRLSSVEIHKNEPLRRNVSMNLKERMSLGVEVGKFVVLPRFVQFAVGQIRPANQSVGQSCAVRVERAYQPWNRHASTVLDPSVFCMTGCPRCRQML